LLPLLISFYALFLECGSLVRHLTVFKTTIGN
jgi:hypothetical protein